MVLLPFAFCSTPKNELINIFFSIESTRNLNLSEITISEVTPIVEKSEKWYSILIQIIIPFLIAGFGMVAAGILLDEVQVIQF